MPSKYAILAILFLAVGVSAVQKLDATMCVQDDAALGASVTGCLSACQSEWDSTQKANYLMYQQSANRDCDSEWLACAQQCPQGIEIDGGIDYGPKIECETKCTDDMKTCEDAVSSASGMAATIQSRLTRCSCENCLIPYCRFFEDPDCAETIRTCDGIQQLFTSSKYPESSKSFIGCNTSTGTAATLTKLATGGTNGGNQQSSGQQSSGYQSSGQQSGQQSNGQQSSGSQSSGSQSSGQQSTNQQTQTTTQKQNQIQKRPSTVDPKLDVQKQKSGQKAKQVEQKVEQIKQNKNADKKDFVIIKPSGDGYVLDFGFKTKYYLNQVSNDYIDKIIEDVPIVNLFGTIIKSKKDDEVFQSKEDKVKKNMIDHKTDYYGGKAMTHYDDDAEKKLSPAKTFVENVADKVTFPFKWTFDKLGGFFKSETAKGGSALYKDFEALVKDKQSLGLNRENAIQRAKDDFKEMYITNRKYGIYTRATKDTNVDSILNNVANDLKEDGRI